MPRFEPKPANDFIRFIDIYYSECRRRVPKISAIAGKWRFEDLIPGLSDFDTRFIVEDGMSIKDWCEMSHQVGRVHLHLCEEYPHWARNLEHLPGVNLEWRELIGPETYYPEYPQWTFYATTDPDRLQRARSAFTERQWDARDEYFHLKKFCLFYGRYDRQIDPPVNLGPFENKYVLHSRFMHYFCPPLQAAVSLLRRRAVPGKLESIRLARERFPSLTVLRELHDAVERHYEVPELYREPELTRLEDRLENALAEIKEELPAVLTLVPNAAEKDVSCWKSELNDLPVDPNLRIFDAAKFSRLMKGRLEFYADSPPHFDAVWPIENELSRIRRNFFEIPFATYWELATGETVRDPITIVDDLCPDIITPQQKECIIAFGRLLNRPRTPDNAAEIAAGIARVFDGFFAALNAITQAAREQTAGADQ